MKQEAERTLCFLLRKPLHFSGICRILPGNTDHTFRRLGEVKARIQATSKMAPPMA